MGTQTNRPTLSSDRLTVPGVDETRIGVDGGGAL